MADTPLHHDNNTAGPRVDLGSLRQLTGGDAAMVAKYIRIFLTTAPEQLDKMRQAIKSSDAEMLGIALHTLKSQADFMGIRNVLPALIATTGELKSNKKVTEPVKRSSGFIFTEITLACNELKKILEQQP